MHRARRNVVPQRETPKESSIKPQSRFDSTKCKEDILQSQRLRSTVPKSNAMVYVSGYNHDDVPITPPSEGVTTVDAHDVNIMPLDTRRDQPIRPQINDAVASSGPGPGNALGEVHRKVHFSSDAIATSRGNNFSYL